MEKIINEAWDNKENIGNNDSNIETAISQVMQLVNDGKVRVAENNSGNWTVNQWVKKAILLSFKFNQNAVIDLGGGQRCFDKVPLRFSGYSQQDFEQAGFRVVPNATVRYGSYIAPNVVLMPSYVNIGAYIGGGTLVDTWATIGSCAQIGKNCHISGGVGIGWGY